MKTPWWKPYIRRVEKWELDDVAIGANRRRHREAYGISLRTFAKAIGLSAPYISDLELGRRRWSEELIHRFEVALAKCIEEKR